MANKTFNVRIKNRYDSYENWANSGLVLEAGEVAIAYTIVNVDIGNGKIEQHPELLMKVGDGSSTFAALPWVSAKAADVAAWAKAANKPTYDASEITGIADYIADYVQDSMGISVDTNDVFRILKVDDNNYKLQTKGKAEADTAWADVENSVITIPDTTTEVATQIENALKVGGVEKYALATDVGANTDAIAILNGNASVEGSIDKKVSDAINTFATQVSSDNTVNTYKELIEYAATHGAEFTTLVGEVTDNTNAIETLNGDATVAGSVDKKVADAIAALQIGDYAKAADLTAAINQHNTDKTALETAIAGKADDSALAAIAKSGNVNDLVQTTGDILIFDCGSSAE